MAKIVFIGAVEFSYHVLKALIDSNFFIQSVFTKRSSLINSDFFDLSEICKRNNINIDYVKNINSKENIELIKKYKPDFIFCIGWSYLLSIDVLSIPKYGTIGYHPADLPKNRGRHPLIWALALGLNETASTFFLMDEGTDSGNIISKEKIKISEKDNASSLYKKMIDTGTKQIFDFATMVHSYKLISKPQDNKKANYWRKRGEIDGKIDWRMSSKNIYNLIRSLSKPYVGAHFEYENKKIKVWNSEMIEEKNANIEPGKILSIKENEMIVKTGDKAILIYNFDMNLVKDLSPGDYL